MPLTPYASYAPSLIPPPPATPGCVGSIRLDLTTECAAELDYITELCRKVKANDVGEKDKGVKKALGKEISKQVRALLSLIADSSICLIEVLLPSRHIVETDGLIGISFLDNGAYSIAVDCCSNTDALSLMRLPKTRAVASYNGIDALKEVDWKALEILCDTVSVALLDVGADATTSTTAPASALSTTVSPEEIRSLVPSTMSLILTVSSTHPLIPSLIDTRNVCNMRTCIVGISPESLGELFSKCCVTDRQDGLFTTVVCTRSGVALGLVYSSSESIKAAITSGRGVYYSRSRKGLWRKGDTSGHYQVLHGISLDCDGDALRFTVTQRGDKPCFCHLNTLTCWGEGCGVNHLEGTLNDRLVNAPEGSYTKRLFDDETLLKNKLLEESLELIEAVDKDHVAAELADVLYFALVKAVKFGVSIDDAVGVLDERARKITRRKGDDKVERIKEAEEVLKKI